MEKIAYRGILDLANDDSAKKTMERLVGKLQELSELLEPETSTKRKLFNIRKQIQNNSITREHLEDLICAHILNTGWWQEQALRAYEISCIYTAIAQVKLGENKIAEAAGAMCDASSYYGLAAGFSHPRRIEADKKAREGANAKHNNQREKLEKILELLEYHKPQGGWPTKSKTAKLIAPYFQAFLTQALQLPKDTLKNVEAEVLKLLDNKNTHKLYKIHASPELSE
ncbi:hypothetical protein [Pseudomonas aeruginosa]|uniref:hypothetical protein n=1 Tax=Pseudomonas aeruginosa TaxID=287 RepID=UPI001FD54ED9|nr:hypothetical protein [Pseudomonas aeruginosa]